jgi:uncharacterized Tic20 family protein
MPNETLFDPLATVSRVIKLWSRHSFVTSLLLASSASAFLIVLANPNSSLRNGNGATLYTAVITAAAALAALGVIPISIILGLSSPRVMMLKREKSHLLRRTVKNAVFWHLSTIVIAVISLALDSTAQPLVPGRIAVVVTLVLGVEATVRIVIEFLAMLKLDAETAATIGVQQPLSSDFATRMTDPAVKNE